MPYAERIYHRPKEDHEQVSSENAAVEALLG
jgi:hypothetical protein